MDRKNISHFVLWTVAIISVFLLAVILGWKIFYGYIVPQANTAAAFSTIGLFAFAAIAGIMVNFGPCSLAVLPAYMSFYLSLDQGELKSPVKKAIKLGAIASIGVIGFYLFLGILFASVGTYLASYAAQLKLVITFIILFFGILLLSGKNLKVGFLLSFKQSVTQVSRNKSDTIRLLAFGLIYGAGGLSCFLPVFLPLIFYPFISGQFFESVVSFIIFGLFQAFFLIFATVLVALGKKTVFKKMIGKSAIMHKVAGLILILTSFYMFGIFYFLGM